MSRTKRLQPAQHLAVEQERRLAQNVAACERRVTEAERKLLELQRYQHDYAVGFNERAESGMGVTQLRGYQAFLARLGAAVRQQHELVLRARGERDQERLKWQAAAQRAKAIEHVIHQWQTEEQRVAAKREQRESDERAQRKVTSL